MVYLEDYMLAYDIFLAEKELCESMFCITDSVLSESVGLISLNESVKDTVIKYIGKITESLQKAWKRFQEIIQNKKDSDFLEGVKDKIASINPKFIIKNCPNYNIGVLDTIKIIPFNYTEMQEFLDNKNDFLKRYYPNIFTDENKSFSENVLDKVIIGHSDRECTRDYIDEVFKNVSNFGNNLSKMKEQLNQLNRVNEEVSRTLDQMNMAATSVQQESVLFCNYITEENDNEVSFEDKPGADTGVNNKSMVKRLTNYVAISTEVITSRMKVYRSMFAFYMKTLKHAFQGSTENDNNQETQTTSEIPKVKV